MELIPLIHCLHLVCGVQAELLTIDRHEPPVLTIEMLEKLLHNVQLH